MSQINPLFINQIKELFPEEYNQFIAALSSPASVSIRTNIGKQSITDITPRENVLWCEQGKYLDKREQFTFDPLFHAGAYYVQDASSMIISYILKQLIDTPSVYLDLCAAPGGKTTTAIDALPEGSLIVANEIIGSRANVLKENIIKWGNKYCAVTNNDSKAISRLGAMFDVIAADVPCSGEGMFRKDDEAVAQWTPALVAQCAERQQEIIDNAWKALKPGGLFIYSTCTFNREENEDMVKYICDEYDAETIDMQLPAEWNIHGSLDTNIHAYRFLPHLTKGEGLFISVIKKPTDTSSRFKTNKVKKNNKVVVTKDTKQWLTEQKRFEFTAIDDTIYAYPTEYADVIGALQHNLRLLHAGVEVATIKGKDIIPSTALALSIDINKDIFTTIDVNYADAITYLRGETINIEAPKGFVLITYKKHPLGFMKNIGNRANNLYPKEWRIRSSYAPTEAPKIV